MIDRAGMTNDFAERRFETADGLSLAADIAGPPGAPAVILLHGGGQTRHSWAGTMRQLVARGYFVISYDARGHGDSDWSPTADYLLDALAADLAAVRETVAGPVAFVGASMGGMTGFHALGRSGSTIGQVLVMVDIVLRPAPGGVEKIRSFMSANRDGFRDLAEAAAAVTAYNPDRPRPGDPRGLMKNLRMRDDGRLHWHWDPRMLDVDPSIEPPSRLDALIDVSRGVTVPTLVVRGQHSDIVDDEGIAEMRRLVPQSEILEVPGAGHMLAGDRNDIFGAGVIAFLDRHFGAGA